MSDTEVALLKEALHSAKNYLEYGAGGSTRLAVSVTSILKIIAVDSDPAFISSQLLTDPNIQVATRSGQLRFVLVDIGPTKAWGHPVDCSKSHLWPNYALCPYLHDFDPDLILIDGRFRVACGLAAALQAPNATVLIHDYPNRTEYHILERFYKIEACADKLVRCRRVAKPDEEEARGLLKDYLYAPAELDPSPARRSKLKRLVSRLTHRKADGHD